MEHTEYYQLSLWEQDDRIQMEDFNADNAKIDAAIAEKANSADLPAAIAAASPIVKLKDLTLTANTRQWDIDMSGIDLAQYQKLLIYPKLRSNSSSAIYLRINGISTSVYGYNGGSVAYGAAVPVANSNYSICEISLYHNLPSICLATLDIASNTTLTGYSVNSCPDLASGVTRLDTLNFLSSASDGILYADSEIQIYGLRQ